MKIQSNIKIGPTKIKKKKKKRNREAITSNFATKTALGERARQRIRIINEGPEASLNKA